MEDDEVLPDRELETWDIAGENVGEVLRKESLRSSTFMQCESLGSAGLLSVPPSVRRLLGCLNLAVPTSDSADLFPSVRDLNMLVALWGRSFGGSLGTAGGSMFREPGPAILLPSLNWGNTESSCGLPTCALLPSEALD